MKLSKLTRYPKLKQVNNHQFNTRPSALSGQKCGAERWNSRIPSSGNSPKRMKGPLLRHYLEGLYPADELDAMIFVQVICPWSQVV